jgi:hypothetical protein
MAGATIYFEIENINSHQYSITNYIMQTYIVALNRYIRKLVGCMVEVVFGHILEETNLARYVLIKVVSDFNSEI